MEFLVFAAILTIFIPLFSFLILIFADAILPAVAAWISVVFSSASFFLATYCFANVWNQTPIEYTLQWFEIAGGVKFYLSLYIDNQTAVMALVITSIALLVTVYSIEYKKGDKHYNRFFAYLGIFVFAMLGLIMSSNLMVTFIFWELVGFASYLLIGFWYDKEVAVQANKKAFLVNRVADIFFIIGLMFLWNQYQTFDINLLKANFTLINSTPAIACIFVACMGKSAQFPFQIWLPDAMEAPTPVSALIHAATMVAAGVYLMVRLSFMINVDVSLFIATIGAITAIIGAFCAISQFDFKKILAFSTISQLGIMMTGIGIGAFEGSFFHLITHAFFKACLFLCAGSVIHALAHVQDELVANKSEYYFDKQDIRNMGGLYKFMPFTFVAFLASGGALAGLPLFSGFISKESIITAACNKSLESTNSLYSFIVIALFATSCMTAFYVFKLGFSVFFGNFKIKNIVDIYAIKVKENGFLITIPLLILGILSFGFVYGNNFIEGSHSWFMKGFLQHNNLLQYQNNHTLVSIASIMLLIIGGLLAFIYHKNYLPAFVSKNNNTILYKLYNLSYNQLYMNKGLAVLIVKPTIHVAQILVLVERNVNKWINILAVSQVVLAHILVWFDKKIIDGIVKLLSLVSFSFGNTTKKFQGGNVQSYFLWALIGLIISILVVFFL